MTAILFDLLTILGLWFVGLRFGGRRLGAVLAFAWAAYPFTQYVSNSNTNDAIMPCFLVWAFWLVGATGRRAGSSRPLRAGRSSRRSSSRRSGSRIRRGGSTGASLAGFVAGTLAVFSILLLDPHPLHEIATFWHRTVGYQLGRDAPWSLWDWRQYHARGLPDFHPSSALLQVMLLVGAFAVAFRPRRKSPLQLVAFTAVLLAGFEMVQTYWLYTYIPWFFPFAAIALLVPRRLRSSWIRSASTRTSDTRSLIVPSAAAGGLAPTGAGPLAVVRQRGSAKHSRLDADLDPARLPVVGARDDDAFEPHAAFGGLEPDG